MAAAPALAEESGDRSVSRRAAAGAKEAPLQAARGGRKADLGTRTGHHAREGGWHFASVEAVSPDASAFSGDTLEVRNGAGCGTRDELDPRKPE